MSELVCSTRSKIIDCSINEIFPTKPTESASPCEQQELEYPASPARTCPSLIAPLAIARYASLPMEATRCVSTSGLPRQNQHFGLGAFGLRC